MADKEQIQSGWPAVSLALGPIRRSTYRRHQRPLTVGTSTLQSEEQ